MTLVPNTKPIDCEVRTLLTQQQYESLKDFFASQAEAKGEDAFIHIEDNGPGVSAEVGQRLFEPFATTKAHGTGLGLAITRKHIEAHGGRLRVRSAPDKRTTFEILLPPTTA